MLNDTQEAVQYIRKMYHRIYKTWPLIHLEEDKVHYIFLDNWCKNKFRLELLCRLVHRAVNRHEDAAIALVEDLNPQLLKRDLTSELYWMSGYFTCIEDSPGARLILIEEDEDDEDE